MNHRSHHLDTAAQAEAIVGAVHRKAVTDAAWRARIEERLDALTQAMNDVQMRVNATFALIAAAVIAQVVLRLAGR